MDFCCTFVLVMDLTGIKNIIFDFGGVLINLNQKACMNALIRLGIKDIADYITPYGHIGPFGRLENGDIDAAGFHRALREDFHIQATDEEIDEAWNAFMEDIPEKKMAVVHALAKKYRVFLLSNTSSIHIRSLKQFDQAGYPLKECFEKQYYSFEIKSSKPKKEIFDYVLNDADIKAEETLLIDDGPSNCRMAESMGIKTYCPKTSEDFCAALFPEETADYERSAAVSPAQVLSDAGNDKAYMATIGFFDGVHLGHKYLIDILKQTARKRNMAAMVVSVWPHPRMVLHSDYCPALLSDYDEKQALLKNCGADKIIMMPFTTDLASCSALRFMKMLHDDYHVRCLLIGYDHHFGHKNEHEDIAVYQEYGKRLGIEVLQADSLCLNRPESIAVSSSQIRRFLSEGRVEDANAFLGYDYCMTGKVKDGFKNGRKLGFPTANLEPSTPCKFIPGDGVYAVGVEYLGQGYSGMLNIGHRPTLHNGNQRSIEVHILDFSEDIYDETIVLTFKKFLRPEIRFESAEALSAQLEKDRQAVLELEA